MSRTTISVTSETYQKLLQFKLDLSAKLGKELTFDDALRRCLDIAKKEAS